MAPRTSWRQKAKAGHNVSNIKARKYVEAKADIESGTTATPITGSPCCAESDQDWRSSVSTRSPSSSPISTKTSLKSIKSKATMFVPSGFFVGDADGAEFCQTGDAADPSMMLPPPFMPSPGKDAMADVIQNALGSEVWDLNMMDMTSYTGDWHTAVAVTIPALNASMCHLMASQDAEPLKPHRTITTPVLSTR